MRIKAKRGLSQLIVKNNGYWEYDECNYDSTNNRKNAKFFRKWVHKKMRLKLKKELRSEIEEEL